MSIIVFERPPGFVGRRVSLGPTGGVELTEQGDYCGPTGDFTAGLPAVFFRLPIERLSAGHCHIHHVVSPPHRFTENDDGTLTIASSIAAYWEGRLLWHGYLENGIWREC